jgi:hypothetical protein
VLTDKRFWLGFALAYGIAVFWPPSKMFGGKKPA